MTGITSSSTSTSASTGKTKNATITVDKDALYRAKGMDFARQSVQKMFHQSVILDRSAEYPQFDLTEVQLGKVLGCGGFGTVSEVRAFSVESDASINTKKKQQPTAASKLGKSTRFLISRNDNGESDEILAAGQMESRKFIAEHCIRNGGDARYALKILSPEVIKETGKFIQGVVDMAVETRFLSSIEHPNIIKIRATAKCEPYDEKYFIVMDRLYDTLEKRIKTWGNKFKRCNGVGRLAGGKKKLAALYEEKMVAAFDLAAAVQHLHSRSIIYRDLKPENVGFDIRGDIKIFDFGLAKEVANLPMHDDGTYKLTGMTGSPRYMAPEVGLEKPYNSTCDSYSFAVMLWEMLAMKVPFELYTLKKLQEKVWAREHKRPFVDEAWPVPIKILLKRSWAQDLSTRNDMDQIVGILRKECVRARGGDEAGLEHQRRRSTFVFRPNKGNNRKSVLSRD